MLKVGLTGGIGSGKSTVAQIFKVLGIPVFDADVVAKNIMQTDTALIAAVVETFGETVYTNGQLNRKVLADIVFNDTYKLEQLNALVHPATIAAADRWMAEQTTPYVIKEAALLFESGSVAHLDKVIGVTAPQTIRIQRVMQRDQTTRQEVLTRMNRQIDDSIKMRLCDFVLQNDEQSLLLPKVVELHHQLLSLANKCI
jgi:dephospho-CoA kinase